MLLEGRARHSAFRRSLPRNSGTASHIDIGDVEPATEEGCRGWHSRVRRIEGMNGVETDEVGSPGGGILQPAGRIAEIADAPVVAAAQASWTLGPHTLRPLAMGACLYGTWGDDETHGGQRLVICPLPAG